MKPIAQPLFWPFQPRGYWWRRLVCRWRGHRVLDATLVAPQHCRRCSRLVPARPSLPHTWPEHGEGTTRLTTCDRCAQWAACKCVEYTHRWLCPVCWWAELLMLTLPWRAREMYGHALGPATVLVPGSTCPWCPPGPIVPQPGGPA